MKSCKYLWLILHVENTKSPSELITFARKKALAIAKANLFVGKTGLPSAILEWVANTRS